jgi:hypothetical protein
MIPLSSIIVTELKGKRHQWDQMMADHFGFELRGEGIFQVVGTGKILYQASIVDLQSVRMTFSNGKIMLMNFLK